MADDPEGSASTTRTGRAQDEASANAVELTPGAPDTETSVIIAIAAHLSRLSRTSATSPVAALAANSPARPSATITSTTVCVSPGVTFNTVAEELCDLVAPSFHPVVRIVKDMAAGGVLICAVFAVGVGVCLFWQPASFLRIWRYFLDNPAMLAVLLASIALALVYILAGPLGIRDFFRKKKLPRTP